MLNSFQESCASRVLFLPLRSPPKYQPDFCLPPVPYLTSAAATADFAGNALDQVSCMRSLFHCCISCHNDQILLFLPQEEASTITPSPSCSFNWSPRSRRPFISTPSTAEASNFHTFYFHNLIHDISKRLFCCFAL